MGRTRIVSTGALVAVALLAASSCKSKSATGPETNPDLVGTYDLVSFTLQGLGTVAPPMAIGTLVLTLKTYDVTVAYAVSDSVTQNIADQGTYTVSGNHWTQTSTVQNVQSVGTYSLDSSGRLSVDVTTAGQQESTVWQKR